MLFSFSFAYLCVPSRFEIFYGFRALENFPTPPPFARERVSLLAPGRKSSCPRGRREGGLLSLSQPQVQAHAVAARAFAPSREPGPPRSVQS